MLDKIADNAVFLPKPRPLAVNEEDFMPQQFEFERLESEGNTIAQTLYEIIEIEE